MTRFTGNILVFPFQFKICFVVIKILHSSYCRKCFIVMAIGTILTEFVLMGIFVAIAAATEFNTFKLLEFHSVVNRCFMTFSADNLFMFTGKLKLCFVVIELCSWNKFFIVMAIGTI